MKLDSAEAILGWATQQGYDGEHDTATAERLALAVRCLGIVEASAEWERTHASRCDCSTDILAEAAQKEGK